MRIESGPTGERKIRTLLMLIMVAAFSIWFAYDGFIGYPAKNFKEHLEQLPTDLREEAAQARIYESVTAGTLEAAEAAAGKLGKQKQKAALEELYGGPPSYETPDMWYYFGPCYRVAVTLSPSKPPTVMGSASEKTQTSILWQKLLSLVLGAAAALLLLFWLRILRTRLVLDDAGLTYRGRGPIRWDDMKALRTSEFAKKGWVDLVYDDHGTERSLRLDEYHVSKFDAAIDAICSRKAFENPLPVDEGKDRPQD
ncbi:MAG: hypothetical protein ABII12_16690 [Planctomycetota bacterium]